MGTERAELLARIARTAALAVLVVVAASAYLRLAQAGFSCADWPACYGHVAENAARLATSETVFWVRVAHRVAAMVISVAVLLIVYLAWRGRREQPARFTLAIAALALTAFLALLGRWTPGTRLPAVTLGNLLAGFSLLAVLWRLSSVGPEAANKSPARLVILVMLLLAAQVALGGLLSARFAGPACPAYPACGAPVVFAAEAFNPFSAVTIDAAGGAVREAAHTGLVLAHRAMALLLSLVVALLAFHAFRRGGAMRLRAIGLVAMLGIEYALGVAVALTAPPLFLVFTHNFGAAILVMLVAEIAGPEVSD